MPSASAHPARRSAGSIRHGNVVIVVQDGSVVQIETSEKFAVAPMPMPMPFDVDASRRLLDDDGRLHVADPVEVR